MSRSAAGQHLFQGFEDPLTGLRIGGQSHFFSQHILGGEAPHKVERPSISKVTIEVGDNDRSILQDETEPLLTRRQLRRALPQRVLGPLPLGDVASIDVNERSAGIGITAMA